jgi:FkbM family methyltransferase
LNIQIAKLGNLLYKLWPGVYRPLYGLYKHWSDREERALLASMIKPGMTVLDIGANIGVYTRFLAELTGPSGRVIAFEPEPKNYALLQRAVAGMPQVTALQAAVGERSGALRLYVADDLNVDHHTYDDGEGRRAVDVPAIALDDYLKPGEGVDVIKMDIQGAELSALRGAERVLTENRNIRMLLEFWPYGLARAGTSARELLQFLERCGFRVRLTERGNAAAVGTEPNDYANLIAERGN